MTRQDYELIARVVSRLEPEHRAHAAWCFLVELRKDNSLFKPVKFLTACKLKDTDEIDSCLRKLEEEDETFSIVRLVKDD